MSDSTSPSKRRTLLWLLSAGSAALLGAIFYPVAAYLKPPKLTGQSVSSVKIGAVEDFSPSSGSLFRFGDKPGILMRYSDGSFRAFSATCTHLDCTVQHRPDLGIIWCSCHNGRYDLDGQNISGPPPKPLASYLINEVDGTIFVSRKDA